MSKEQLDFVTINKTLKTHAHDAKYYNIADLTAAIELLKARIAIEQLADTSKITDQYTTQQQLQS